MSRLLEVRELYKGFRSGDQHLEVLIDLSLNADQGDMIGVTGASGSGKSTLLHMIGGMDRPDRGSIRIMGREISNLNSMELSQFRNSAIGFVFQFHHLLPEFTALENVMMPLLLRGTIPPEAAKSAKEILKEVGLDKSSSAAVIRWSRLAKASASTSPRPGTPPRRTAAPRLRSSRALRPAPRPSLAAGKAITARYGAPPPGPGRELVGATGMA